MFDFERASSRLFNAPTRLPSALAFVATLLIIATPRGTAAQSIPTAGQLQVNGQITIVFTATTVSCTGLPEGGTVSLVGFMIDRQTGSQAISIPMVSDTVQNNSFSATIPGGVKTRSIWLLIDQTSGSYTVAEPEGSILNQMPVGAVTLIATPPSSAIATISRAHTHAIAINYVPQLPQLLGLKQRGYQAMDATPAGFSVIDAKDGSASDNDGTIDGIVHLNLPSFFDPNQSSACLFVVDDRTLEFSVTYLKPDHLPVCGDPRQCL